VEIRRRIGLELELEVLDEEDRVQIRGAPGPERLEGPEEEMPKRENGVPIRRRVVVKPEEGQRLPDVEAMWRGLEEGRMRTEAARRAEETAIGTGTGTETETEMGVKVEVEVKVGFIENAAHDDMGH
jgi:hypothetical protein